MIHEIGLKLHSTAHCTAIKCIRHSCFTMDHALLMKHWDLQNIVANIEECDRVLDENKHLLKQESVALRWEVIYFLCVCIFKFVNLKILNKYFKKFTYYLFGQIIDKINMKLINISIFKMVKYLLFLYYNLNLVVDKLERFQNLIWFWTF